ncbi:uncharacterized protein TRAVEDRAFT_43407 [Trametes versicolor FP-101664 SS1]|uniref:uncharacterized protein n=1 Tax=Trametes versicolor (strain FP-101664) TaxID=717944 RepID=UPI000462327B|nr:uncharacterized protein TRAVEDRAFT_43407 [Trametes versicolor FP-101664 SS1]EIW63100.1 hypothetical protein TRAVEDRAFT_43407 [Trametes versicolor FP-101664 SS1]
MPAIDAARTADTVSASIPPELFGPLQEFFACAIIGFPIATTIYGITILQTYLYFRRYPKDSAALKSLVGGLWAMDTLTIALISHAIYNMFVLNLAHLADDVELPWSVALEVAVTDIIVVAVQFYFANQLYKLSHGNKIFTGSIVVLTIPTIVVGICKCATNHTAALFTHAQLPPPPRLTVTLVATFRDSADGLRLFPATSRVVSLLASLQTALTLLCDILITGGLCFYIRGARVAGGRARTNALVDKLMVYAINRGALVTVIQGVSLVTLVAIPRGYVYIIFSMMVGKRTPFPLFPLSPSSWLERSLLPPGPCPVYVNSLLASLNVRASLNRTAFADTTAAAPTIVTTLQFRDGQHTLPNADNEYSATVDGAGTISDSEQGWEDAQRSRLTAPRVLVLRSSTGTLGSGEEVKMRECVENAA